MELAIASPNTLYCDIRSRDSIAFDVIAIIAIRAVCFCCFLENSHRENIFARPKGSKPIK